MAADDVSLRGSALSADCRECGLDFSCDHTQPRRLSHPEISETSYEMRRMAASEYPGGEAMGQKSPQKRGSSLRRKPDSLSVEPAGYSHQIIKKFLCSVVVLFLAVVFILAMASLACVTTHTECWIDSARQSGHQGLSAKHESYVLEMEQGVTREKASVHRLQVQLTREKQKFNSKVAALKQQVDAATVAKEAIIAAAEEVEREKASVVTERQVLEQQKTEIGLESKWFESKLRDVNTNNSTLDSYIRNIQNVDQLVTQQGHITHSKAHAVKTALAAMKKATSVLHEATTSSNLEGSQG